MSPPKKPSLRKSSSTKSLPYWKLDAAGNQFVLFNAAPPTAKSRCTHWVHAANSHEKADGVVFVWKVGKEWRWRFFNPDAKEVSICGNAARALPLWLRSEAGVKGPLWKWKGKLGQFTARLAFDGLMEVSWPNKRFSLKEAPPAFMEHLHGFNDHGLAGVYVVNVGNPHLVMMNHDVWSPQLRQANNSLLRRDPLFGKEGANVTWLSLKGKQVVTFERGVEGETQACGSGALAAFLALNAYESKHQEGPPRTSAQLKFPGGTLRVSHERQQYWLGGPARILKRGDWKG